MSTRSWEILELGAAFVVCVLAAGFLGWLLARLFPPKPALCMSCKGGVCGHEGFCRRWGCFCYTEPAFGDGGLPRV